MKVRYLTVAGIMAALITLMTAYLFHIPIGVNGGYLHIGDAMIYLAAVLLPKPYALAVAAIGGGLADFLTAPMWAPATIVIKMLIVIPFASKANRLITPRNMIATVLAYIISGVGYWIAEYIIFGTWTVLLITMLQTFLQSAGSAVLFVFIGLAFDRAHVKSRLMK